MFWPILFLAVHLLIGFIVWLYWEFGGEREYFAAKYRDTYIFDKYLQYRFKAFVVFVTFSGFALLSALIEKMRGETK